MSGTVDQNGAAMLDSAGRATDGAASSAAAPAATLRLSGPSPSFALFLFDLGLAAICWPALLAVTGLWSQAAPAGAAGRLAYPAASLGALYVLGLYRRDMILETRKALGRLPLAIGLGSLGALLLLLLVRAPAGDQARLFFAALGCGTAGGALARVGFYALRRRGLFRRRLLVLGAGRRAWDLVWMLGKEGRNLHYQIVFVHDPVLGEIDPRLANGEAGPIVGIERQGVLAVARRFAVEQIVVAPDERRGMDLEALLQCKIAGFPVQQYLGFVEKEIQRIDLKRMELGWLLFSDGFAFGLMDRLLKRVVDLAVSSVMLLLFAPVLLLAVLAIRLDDGGPVLYRQDRVTRQGRIFRIMKLRTMRVDAERHGAVWAADKDARITRVGALLRRTRIDEMPQLFNVLRGDMSLVGPRPERPGFVAMLAEHLPLYHERHMVKAGLTGWAQINYPYGASIDDARSKLSYDLYYVKNFSILFDLLIIAQTLRVVFWPGGVR
ncbi:MAG TPA: TIGR03013 family XrtA/PEP-CTERM system glycosyltransferase [Acetobacteraceae bacterium]|nr:TIGR03013 family XrtA/PEP-CTERM system glycosyltransferase [Acetobacteraceae bacterium]